jgi:16S rRNA (cytosine967-C5)-methyltransferase
MKISAARAAAYAILLRVETENAFSSSLLDKAASGLSPKDRSLCHELTLGTLRRQIWLDDVIDTLAKNKKLDVEIRIALRLGLYQIQFLGKIPAYSAINESVQLAQFAGKTSAKGLVNAVLRRAQRGIDISETDDPVDRLALATSHPRWLIEKWISDIGFEETERLADSNNRRPLISFRMTAAARDEDAVRSFARASEFTKGCFLADSFDDRLLDLAARNVIYFQDEASQMAANCVRVAGMSRILDVCAAPGSKTTLIARNIKQAEKPVFLAAGDRYPGRVGVLRKNCLDQGVPEVSIVQYDAEAALPFADESFDSVLVDSPCSGTGTIRHNPEIRYRVRPEDLVELPDKQLTILKNASKVVARGGSLIYSTCSLEPEENEAVCRLFLGRAPEFSIAPLDLNERFITESGFGRTYPQRDDMDGFFIAAFRRG